MLLGFDGKCGALYLSSLVNVGKGEVKAEKSRQFTVLEKGGGGGERTLVNGRRRREK